MKKKTTLILLILTFSIYAANINVQISAEENNYRPTSLALTPHDSISITSDSDLEVFPGTGTGEDPYIIEGYNITTSNHNGIYISDTTKYFIVRNCYVDAVWYGIYIHDVAYGSSTVANNTCNNNNYLTTGISISHSGSSTVANNTCKNNGIGIILFFSDSSIVTNNTCSNNYNYGIYLEYSSSSTVANNMCNNNGKGIYLEYSSSSTVANNMCNNNDRGISLWFSGSSTVVNNTFTNCGLYVNEDTIDAYLSDTVESNWVNGKKLGFYTNLDSTTISKPVYGQLLLVNCTNVTVRDQILNSATIGLFLYSCTYSVIINNTCSSNSYYNIYLYSSGSSTVTNNTCSNNIGYYGIFLSYSSSFTVDNNTCNNNYIGIYLWFSGSSTVDNNTCSNNGDGILLSSSGSSTVTNNTCSNNDDNGILLYNSNFCVVTCNLLQENEFYGVYLIHDSDDNLIHHNTFVNNNLEGTSQAFDDGTNNFWYDSATLEGNFWSDWDGTSSYSIEGSVGSEDLYPLYEIGEYSVEFTTDRNKLNFTFTLLMLIVPLILTRIISKKTKKK